MSRDVECIVEDTLIEGQGSCRMGICVTCSRCEHEVELPGIDGPELREAALSQLKEECELGEDNFYFITKEGR